MGRKHTAIGFIGMICTIGMAITPPTERDTNGICTPELSFMAGRKVTILFIRIVTTIIPMVTFLRFINTPSTCIASKLVQLTCCCICSNLESKKVVSQSPPFLHFSNLVFLSPSLLPNFLLKKHFLSSPLLPHFLFNCLHHCFLTFY